MSKRRGMPKPSASERTRYRWRMRNDIETKEDKARFTLADTVKKAFYKLRHPEESQ